MNESAANLVRRALRHASRTERSTTFPASDRRRARTRGGSSGPPCKRAPYPSKVSPRYPRRLSPATTRRDPPGDVPIKRRERVSDNKGRADEEIETVPRA